MQPLRCLVQQQPRQQLTCTPLSLQLHQLLSFGGDEIRTVFVSGFPNDVKERELHNLLRFMPGYEASQMNWKTGGPQGFALFSSAVHARAVVELLSGLQV